MFIARSDCKSEKSPNTNFIIELKTLVQKEYIQPKANRMEETKRGAESNKIRKKNGESSKELYV